MKIIIECQNDKAGNHAGERIDISDNLYWFEENGVMLVDERGECSGHYGDRYRIIIEQNKKEHEKGREG